MFQRNKSPEKYTNIFNPKCKKCSNDLASMKNPPEEWYCDGWDPPNTHCVGGNNIKLDKDSKAYCCPNVVHCNWILCEKCYISIGKKNKTLYCEPEPEEEDGEYKLDEIEIRKRIETEAQIMLRDKIENMRKCAPSLKCFSSYEEYLDLAKGLSYESRLSLNFQKVSNDTFFRLHDLNTALVDSSVTDLKSEINSLLQ